ncbi:RDD family protein, partial [Luedemannella flava]|uniref:RDD family protein n=1 Tax=Luedemannella flava TaxID=349316 RepID=UPI0031D5DC72
SPAQVPWPPRAATATLTPPPGWPAGYPFPFPRSLRMPPPDIHGLPLASAGARLVARLIDIAIVLGLNVIANGYFVYLYFVDAWPMMQEIIRAQRAGETIDVASLSTGRMDALQFTILFVGLAVWFAYEVPFVAGSGRTVGKRLMKLRVMRLESTEPMGFYRSWRRWFPMALPTMLWYCCFIGVVIQFIDSLFVAIDRPLRQAIHDKYALTVVVQELGTPAEGDRT